MAKSKTKMYTTSELAQAFGISVVSASRFIVKHDFKPIKTGNHNAKYYNDAVFQQMKKYYQNKPKRGLKQDHSVTKDDIIKQLQARIEDQTSTIELLKHQLNVKDDQISAANRIADQAQQLDLTTHKQQKALPVKPNDPIDNNLETHNWLWKIFH